jgi:hypothetical protein
MTYAAVGFTLAACGGDLRSGNRQVWERLLNLHSCRL